jgi:hypothetical protein
MLENNENREMLKARAWPAGKPGFPGIDAGAGPARGKK